MDEDLSQMRSRAEHAGGAAEAIADAASPLRADARHNRDLLITAARELFSARGIEVPLSAVARRAGVSPATLYRRFPTRDSLVSAVFAEQLAECEAVLARAVADEDPWRGLVRLLTTVTTMQARSRGFSAALVTRHPGVLDLEAAGRRADQQVAGLVRRARDAGGLRPDFDHTDVYLLLLAVDSLAAQPTEIAVAASRRLLAYVLQGARAEHASPLPPAVAVEISALHADRVG